MEATKPSEWKKDCDEARCIKLPSGKVLKLKRPTMASLLRKGVIPTHCYKITMGQANMSDPKKIDPEDFKALLDLMAIYVSEAAVEPKVVMKDPVPADAIHIDLLEDDDLMYIFNVMGGRQLAEEDKSHPLDSFSEKPEGALDRPAGAEVQPETVKPA